MKATKRYSKMHLFFLVLEFVVTCIVIRWICHLLLSCHDPETAMTVLLTLVYSGAFFAYHGLRFLAMQPQSRLSAAEHFCSSSRHINVLANVLLPFMFGDRYGGNDELWRRWLAKYEATLVWDERSGKWVESEFLQDAEPEIGN
jgi:hypothetical protein